MASLPTLGTVMPTRRTSVFAACLVWVCINVFLTIDLVSSLAPSTATTRRSFLATSAASTAAIASSAQATADCFSDCFKNCKLIAPKDLGYCQENCRDYCAQTDRNDGLSGSVSASGGEVGILGGTYGTGTVVKGEDKPPSVSLPGLDFSSATGRQLLGYKQ